MSNRVLGRLITAAPEMVKVARTIERVANTNVSVMLLGASGTGKELLARGLARSQRPRAVAPSWRSTARRSRKTCSKANCSGMKRARLPARSRPPKARSNMADGGTLFLDEVGDIPLPLQVKLLRFLQERVIERIGSRKSIPVDTRIVCATHQNLEAMIADGRFREDLFYRLAEIVVKIPSLAERPGDAALLAKAFLARFAREMNPAVKGFAPDALAAIDAWAWPGNVRELENRVKRAVIMAEGKLIGAADLDLARTGRRRGAGAQPQRPRAKRPTARSSAMRWRAAKAISRTPPSCSGSAARRFTICSSSTICRPERMRRLAASAGYWLALACAACWRMPRSRAGECLTRRRGGARAGRRDCRRGRPAAR